MKIYIKTLFALSFLLLGLVRASEVVLDDNGETVTPFDEYYIMPYNFALGGGLSLADTANKTCPVDVIKEFSEVEHGMSLKIIPFLKIGIVLTNIKLRILFADTPECAQSSSDWIVVKENEKWFVGIGGPENHPGREIRKGWFVIEKYQHKGYKLRFCSSDSSANGCGDIGIDVDENQNKRLSLDDEGAYRVVFRKANGSSEPETDRCCF